MNIKSNHMNIHFIAIGGAAMHNLATTKDTTSPVLTMKFSNPPNPACKQPVCYLKPGDGFLKKSHPL